MIDFQQQQKNMLVGLFPDSCNLKAKTKGQAIKHRRFTGHRALWRGLTKFSAHCVVCGGSPVLRSIPPSRPLQLAQAFVLPAARPVFKWATHKFQTGVIGYKRGYRVELRRVRYQSCKQKSKLQQHLDRCLAWQQCHPQRWILCCWSLPQWAAERVGWEMGEIGKKRLMRWYSL